MHSESTSPANGTRRGTASIEAAAEDWFARRDAGLVPEEEAAFRHWLASDPRHAATFARLESAWFVFGKPRRTGTTSDVLTELARRAQQRRKRRRTLVTATALLALFVGAVSWRFTRAPDETVSLSPAATLLAPAQRKLPDGSLVILKPEAQVTEAFSAAVRRVTLVRGEAMFHVQKDSTRPFVVSAGGVEVRAVGTAFSVQLGSGQVEVLITEGTVAVEPGKAEAQPVDSKATMPPATLANSSGFLVEAGHRVVIANPDRYAAPPSVTPIASPEIEERLAWRSPRVEFSGMPLGEAVALLNQTAPNGSLKLIVADPAIAGMRVSGIFRTDNIEAFVLLLESGFGLKAESSDGTIRLTKAPGSAR